MKQQRSRFYRRTMIVGLTVVVIVTAFVWLLLSSGGLIARQIKINDKRFEDFDGKKFSQSTKIDNQWLPLIPGTQHVYSGFTIEGKKRVPRKLVVTITDLTKVIDGVRTLVRWDADYRAGKIEEDEIAFLAQDDDGNVWLLGEYPEEYENGKFVKAPAWIHGREKARAGFAMQANPRLGTSYSQGWGPAVDWTDRGKVDQTGQKTCVPVNCYEDVLVIAESSRKEGPNAEQLKYYTRGVGNVRVGWRGTEEKLQETLELVEIRRLDREALAKARAAALNLDTRGYKFAKKAFAGTRPAEPLD